MKEIFCVMEFTQNNVSMKHVLMKHVVMNHVVNLYL